MGNLASSIYIIELFKNQTRIRAYITGFIVYNRELAKFFLSIQRESILGFVSLKAFVVIIQIHCYSTKQPYIIQYLNKCSSISKENTPLHLYKQVAIWTWSMKHNLPTLGLKNCSRKENYGLVTIQLPKVYWTNA